MPLVEMNDPPTEHRPEIPRSRSSPSHALNPRYRDRDVGRGSSTRSRRRREGDSGDQETGSHHSVERGSKQRAASCSMKSPREQPDPVPLIRKLAEEILSPRHALFEDTLQTGFLAYYEASGDPKAAASAAMHGFLKKERRFQRGLVPLHDGIQPPPEDGDYFRSGPDSVPQNALAALSPREREVLELRYGEEPLIVRQTAERLGMSSSSVQRTYKRAREKLRIQAAQDRYR